MKGVILAAGVGKRMRPLTLKIPKCLLPAGNIPLLQRTVGNLLDAGISELCIVTGYRADQVRDFVSRRFGKQKISLIHNPAFERTNNAYSLSLCKDFVGSGQFLLLDCDILFGKGLLQELVQCQRKPNRLAVRVLGQHDEEEVKVKIDRWDHILEIGKHVPLAETYGESIGIAVFSRPLSPVLFTALAGRMKTARGKREFYEAAFQQLIDDGHRLWAVDISKFPVAEIDTPEDLAHAETSIVPRIDRG